MTTRPLLVARLPMLILAMGLALGLPLAAAPSPSPGPGAKAQAPAFPYRLVTQPERPSPGEVFSLSLEIEGLSEAVLGKFEASPGLDLGLSSSRPFVGKDGLARGSLITLEFRPTGPGPWEILRLEAKGREGDFVLGPLHFEPRAAANPPQGKRAQAWVWVGPDKAFRHSSFSVSLQPNPAAAGPIPPTATASFAPPEGGTLEALPGTGLTWTATALDSGSLDLPQARIEAGAFSGRAPVHSIEVLPLPREIEASRALGLFALELETPPQAIVREGDSLVYSLVLEGQGNLPSINLPKPRLSLNGQALAPDLVSQRRRDSIRAIPGGYAGSVVLELVLEAPGPGNLVLDIPSLAVLGPGGDFSSLGPLTSSIRVLPRSGKTGGPGSDPFLSRLGNLAKAVSARGGDLAGLPALVAKARYAQALTLLGAAPVAVKTSADSRTLEACLLWARGEKGRALAIVYGLARRHEGGPGLGLLAKEASALLGAGKPAAKLLPRASLILVPAAVLFLAFLGFLLAGARAPRTGVRKPLLRGAAGLCLLTALGLGLFAGASLLEDKAEYAVVWTDTLYSVPSALAEGREIVLKGSSARIIGASPDYIGLRMEDGRVGWAPRDSVFSY